MNKKLINLSLIFLLSLFIFQGLANAEKFCTIEGCVEMDSAPPGAIPCETDEDCEDAKSSPGTTNGNSSIWEQIIPKGGSGNGVINTGEGFSFSGDAFTRVALAIYGGVSGTDAEALVRFTFFMLLLIAILVSLKKTGILGDNRGIEAIVALIISYFAVRMISSSQIDKFISNYGITSQIIYSLFWPLLAVILILLFTKDKTHRGLIYGVCGILIWWGIREPLGMIAGWLGHLLLLGFSGFMIFSSLHSHGNLGEGYQSFKGLLKGGKRETAVLKKSWRNWRQRGRIENKEDKDLTKTKKDTRKLTSSIHNVENDVKTRNWKKFMKDNQVALRALKHVCADTRKLRGEFAKEIRRIRQEYKFTHTEKQIEGGKVKRLLQFKNPYNKEVKQHLTKDRKLTSKDLSLLNEERRQLNRELAALQAEYRSINQLYPLVHRLEKQYESVLKTRDGRTIYEFFKKLKNYEHAIYSLEDRLSYLQKIKKRCHEREKIVQRRLKKDARVETKLENQVQKTAKKSGAIGKGKNKLKNMPVNK